MLNSNNMIHLSIILYMFTIITLWIVKPRLMFNEKNQMKEFGLGRYNRTILPFWLVAILISIISYFISLVLQTIVSDTF